MLGPITFGIGHVFGSHGKHDGFAPSVRAFTFQPRGGTMRRYVWFFLTEEGEENSNDLSHHV